MFGGSGSDFIIRAEDHGIPQARHRVILLGVRDDISSMPDTLKQVERKRTAQDVIGDLPPPQREAFLLKEEGGLGLQDIASVTGVDRETVKSRLRYAVNKLRAGLRDTHG